MAEQAQGWYQCPSELPLERYFDGRCWTDRTRVARRAGHAGWHSVAAAFQKMDRDRTAGEPGRVPRQTSGTRLYVPVRAGEPPPALTAGEDEAHGAGFLASRVRATNVVAQVLLVSAVAACSLLVSAMVAYLVAVSMRPTWGLLVLAAWPAAAVLQFAWWKLGEWDWLPESRLPTEREDAVLRPAWALVAARAAKDLRRCQVRIADDDGIDAYSRPGRMVVVTRGALEQLPQSELAALLGRGVGFHLTGQVRLRMLRSMLRLPCTAAIALFHAAGWVERAIVNTVNVVWKIIAGEGDGFEFIDFVFRGIVSFARIIFYGTLFLFLGPPLLVALVGRKAADLAEQSSAYQADRAVATMGMGEDLLSILRRAGDAGQPRYDRLVMQVAGPTVDVEPRFEQEGDGGVPLEGPVGGLRGELLACLNRVRDRQLLSDVDYVRIGASLRDRPDDRLNAALYKLMQQGSAAYCHPSGQRDLEPRVAHHRLARGEVLLGRVAGDPHNIAAMPDSPFVLDVSMLRTSMLVVGPPGAGKTRSVATPIVEHLALQALAGQASVVVIDPKGDDFGQPGHFDVDIDLSNPDGSFSFDLYGGAADPEEAADRLAAALLPVGVSADKTYFMDASKNSLYWALACFHAAHDEYPTVRQLLDVLAGAETAHQSLRDRLKNKGRVRDFEALLAALRRQHSRREDPAASMVERLTLLDRPSLTQMLDGRKKRFAMRDINRPLRVRIALAEGTLPEASRILARLAVAQFVQACSAPSANKSIFKGLVIDEAGRYVDEYVAHGVQRLRSRNAGLVMLTQSLSDLQPDIRPSLFAATGCKAVFAGGNPTDAAYLADYWGTEWVDEVTVHTGSGSTGSTTTSEASYASSQSTGTSSMSSGGATSSSSSTETVSHPGRQHGQSQSRQYGRTVRSVERPIWSASDLLNGIPTGHAVISLARPDGERTPPTLVSLRA
ncbi:DUF2510 domain-containing protein [Micromonospora maritima]|uniref:DUF2510 domain-containing protein n=1 Tax=Micromonospora maritima TaxID=986711 RepID=UPI00157C44EE|nr:DUF2510 domain-containing protein [Micromonospora maritima]